MKNTADPLTKLFAEQHPDTCAARCTVRSQKIYYLLLTLSLLFLLKYRWDIFVFLTTLFLMLLYLSSVFMKICAGTGALFGYGLEKVKPEELPRDEELPVYTILLPLYREREIADKLIPHISALDYPKEKLDVKILLESDDRETLEKIREAPLPTGFSVIRVPDALPKTKPRACNFGLKEAKGEFCVIYDAEDIPEPDQLRKAVRAFRRDTSGKTACIQARLNYHNTNQNWLTRFFTIEYTTYFDLILSGMNFFRIPLPLGGTSNHFRTEYLKKMGGWDPFNVTEDCELGLRIYEAGWTTRVLDSTTWEEANSNLWNWIRQRSRWVKGFIQTHLAHYRNPFRTVKRLGIRGTIGGYLGVGGTAVMMLTNVIFWPLTLWYLFLLGVSMSQGESFRTIICADNTLSSAVTGWECGPWLFRAWPIIYQGPGEDPFLSGLSVFTFWISVFLLFSNFLLIFIHGAACIHRKKYYLFPMSFLMPFYWVLISIGAWKGFLQIFTKPFYWEKTIHGLDGGSRKK